MLAPVTLRLRKPKTLASRVVVRWLRRMSDDGHVMTQTLLAKVRVAVMELVGRRDNLLRLTSADFIPGLLDRDRPLYRKAYLVVGLALMASGAMAILNCLVIAAYLSGRSLRGFMASLSAIVLDFGGWVSIVLLLAGWLVWKLGMAVEHRLGPPPDKKQPRRGRVRDD